MYTVMRFTADASRLDALQQIGATMNTVREGTYDGPRHRGDGFAVEVSSATAWSDQRLAIISFMETFSEHIAAAASLGASVTIDIGVEPEDYARPFRSMFFDAEVLRRIATSGVNLEITMY